MSLPENAVLALVYWPVSPLGPDGHGGATPAGIKFGNVEAGTDTVG